jgi:glycosyltransferase involved in cell wall biosynthesis
VNDRTTLVHVAESFASGTASAIADFVRNYPDAEHHLVYSLRAEAVVDPAELDGFASATPMPGGTLARIRFLRSHLRRMEAETTGVVIVHAHSSKAGGYVRMAVRRSVRRPLLYTPHCYAFERRDVSWSVRQAFRALEWVLSFNTTAVGACSPREASLSRWAASSPRVVMVPNVQPPGLPKMNPTTNGKLRVVGNGRLGPQKDPEFFARAFAAAVAAHPEIEGVWIGGGETHYVDMLHEAGVEVTGWLPRQEALEIMASCDLYLHTALWEGFPISIMEAAGMGMPVVSRRGPYLSGVEMPVVIDEPGELTGAISDLLDAGRLDTLRWTTANALVGNSDSGQSSALRDLYGPLALAG